MTTALLLEVDGGWQYNTIGTGIGAVLAATAVAGAGLMLGCPVVQLIPFFVFFGWGGGV